MPIEYGSPQSGSGTHAVNPHQDKFILTRGERSSVVRPMMIWGTTFDKLEAIKAATNLPYTAILDAMVRFCEQRLEIVGDESECGQ